MGANPPPSGTKVAAVDEAAAADHGGQHVVHTPSNRRRLPAALAVALISAAVLGTAACSPDDPEPDAAAQALAAALADGDLSEVPLLASTPAQAAEERASALEPIAEHRPLVTVDSVAVDPDDSHTAQARLTYSWDFEASEPWTYQVVAPMELVEDAWSTHWSLKLVHPDLLPGLQLTLERSTPTRANILGAGGSVTLVEDRRVLRLGLDKTRVDADEQPDRAREIATLLGLDAEAYAQRVAGAGERAFVEALVVRDENPGVDVDSVLAVPGALAVPDVLPLAPTREFARALLGTAGPATAEIIEASDGAIEAGDLAGLSGLQRQYDEQLRGRPGFVVHLRRADTGDSTVLWSVEPIPGAPLVTTIDPAFQVPAEAVLAGVGPAAAIVAIRPSTGAVLAVANGPGSNGYPTATTGMYAPGSTFKVVSTLALLRAGLTPDSPVDCPDRAVVDGRGFRNFPDYPADHLGTITLRDALAQSCNTAFIGATVDRVDAADRASAAAALGFGIDHDLGFPAFLGSVPEDVRGTEHAAATIGQGRVQASPLAMATVAASVVAGQAVVPWLVGNEPPATDAPAEPLTEGEAAALRDMMRAVVTDGGARVLADVPGDPVGAKTGTAQAGSGADQHNHAWMIATQGDLAVAVFVEDGEYGSTTAGPLMAEFLRQVSGA